MLVRFKCPACKGSHVFDMPEGVIHMTCAQTGRALKLRLTTGGDVKSELIRDGEEGELAELEETGGEE